MTKRAYNQACPTAYGLDLIGERWTLLIVRDLLLGPLRFKDLIARNKGIGRTLLKERLDQMIETGIVAPASGRGTAASGYGLTDKGYALRPIVQSLARWSLDWHGPPNGPPNSSDLVGLALELCDPGGFEEPIIWQLAPDADTLVHFRTDSSGTRGARGPAQYPAFAFSAQIPLLLSLFGARVSDLRSAARTYDVAGDRDAFVRVMKHLRVF